MGQSVGYSFPASNALGVFLFQDIDKFVHELLRVIGLSVYVYLQQLLGEYKKERYGNIEKTRTIYNSYGVFIKKVPSFLFAYPL